MNEFWFETIVSPIGCVDLVAHAHVLISVDFSDCRDRMMRLLEKRFGSFSLTCQPHSFSDRLRGYFAGDLAALDQAPVRLQGTPFQNKVWQALPLVKAGETLTYGDLARQIDQPKAAQAVGRANAQNPILIFLPCHRIIGRDQKMVGYSGGIDRKKWLIEHEQRHSHQVHHRLNASRTSILPS